MAIPLLVGAVVSGVTPFLVRGILAGIGAGLVSYIGFDLAVARLESWVMGGFHQLPTQLLQIVSMLQLDKAIAIIFAAYAARFAFAMAAGSARFTFKK